MILMKIERFAHTDFGTFGNLEVQKRGKKFTCFTVERRWLQNERNVSCIPEGAYRMNKRKSSVVSRTTKGNFKEGWEVTGVPNRSYIMIHPGNTFHDVTGCIAVGEQLGWVRNGLGVTQSILTFNRLMDFLGDGPAELHIFFYQPNATSNKVRKNRIVGL